MHDRRILVATHNAGKMAEMRKILGAKGYEVVSAADLGLPEPEETGTTFEENARIKSLAAREATGLTALSDDSGICVDDLAGRPGVHTADWAGVPRDFARAIERTEAELQAAGATTQDRRGATFVSVLSLALTDGSFVEFRGEVRGTLVWPPREGEGFGFDPVFVPEGDTRTLSQIPMDERFHPSSPMTHRSRAVMKFADWLDEWNVSGDVADAGWQPSLSPR